MHQFRFRSRCSRARVARSLVVALILALVSCGGGWETVAFVRSAYGCFFADSLYAGPMVHAALKINYQKTCASGDHGRSLLFMDDKYSEAQLEIVSDRLFVATTDAGADAWLTLLYICNVNDLPRHTFHISGDDMRKGAEHMSSDESDSTAVEISRLSQGKDAIHIRVSWYAITFLNINVPNSGIMRLDNDIVFLNVKNAEFHVNGKNGIEGQVWWANTPNADRIAIAMPDTAGGFLKVRLIKSEAG